MLIGFGLGPVENVFFPFDMSFYTGSMHDKLYKS